MRYYNEMTAEGLPEKPFENSRSATVIDLPHRNLLEQLEVTNTREGGFIDCYVPTELIDHEEVPVKEEWAQSLAIEMRQKAEANGGTGQMAQIILGYIEGEPKLKIVDGFHRDAALTINEEPTRYATVEKTTWEKLYDDRIFLAKDHVHVRFSRVVQWIREAWEFSGLSDKLTVEQAVLIYRFDTNGSKLHLDPADVDAAKAWIERKEGLWQMAAMTIHSHLMIAANVDPSLVHSTREKKDSRTLDAPTQAIIKIFSDTLPNDFLKQNLVMEVAKQYNFTGPQVKALCVKVKDCKEIAEAQEVIASIDPDNMESEYADTTQRALRRAFDPRYKGAAVLKRINQETRDIGARVAKSLHEREEVDDTMRQQLKETRTATETLIKDLARIVTNLTALIGDTRPEVTASRPIPEQRQSDPLDTKRFTTVVKAYLEGRIDILPPLDSPERISAAEGLLGWDSFIRAGSARGATLQEKILEARGVNITHA